MTSRDRIVLMVMLAAGLLAGSWFIVLSPKRHQAASLNTQIAAAQKRLDTADAQAAQAAAAKRRYDADYSEVAKLGEAVPVDGGVPSLVYQLDSAAGQAKVDFRSVQLAQGAGASPATQTQAAQVAAVGAAQKGQSGSTTTPAPATQAAAATLPPGASVGAAGFPTMPFSFEFDGSFFDMEHFLDRVAAFTQVDGNRISINGRLLTVDGISLTASRFGFPKVKANIAATAYLLPSDEGLTNGATPQGPAATTQAVSATGTAGSSPSTPPAAAATGVVR
jgi:Tfp pilus assembly protein PilO